MLPLQPHPRDPLASAPSTVVKAARTVNTLRHPHPGPEAGKCMDTGTSQADDSSAEAGGRSAAGEEQLAAAEGRAEAGRGRHRPWGWCCAC